MAYLNPVFSKSYILVWCACKRFKWRGSKPESALRNPPVEASLGLDGWGMHNAELLKVLTTWHIQLYQYHFTSRKGHQMQSPTLLCLCHAVNRFSPSAIPEDNFNSKPRGLLCFFHLRPQTWGFYFLVFVKQPGYLVLRIQYYLPQSKRTLTHNFLTMIFNLGHPGPQETLGYLFWLQVGGR